MNGRDFSRILADIMIRLQGNDRDATVLAFTDLASLLRHLDQGDRVDIDDFGLTAIAVDAVRVARKLRNDPHMLSVACTALSMLAKLCRTNNLRGMLAGELGCMELLLTASDSFAYNQYADLHEPLVETLYYMTLNHQDNATLFLGLRGLGILVKVMRDHYCIQNADYQKFACGILNNLAQWQETHFLLQTSGGLHALSDAIQAHPYNSDVLDAAYGAFQRLCSGRTGIR